MISPLTALVAELAESGAVSAEQKVTDAFDIPGTNLGSTDAIDAALSGSGGTFVAGAEAYNSVSLISSLVEGAGGPSFKAASIIGFQQIASAIGALAPGQLLDLSDVAVVKSILQAAPTFSSDVWKQIWLQR